MFAVFFIVGILVSGSLAWAGLVRGELQFSKTRTLNGRTAQVIGGFCLTICLVLCAAVGWIVLTLLTSMS